MLTGRAYNLVKAHNQRKKNMFNKMTIAAIAISMMTATAAMAEDGGGKGDGKNFEQHKQKVLEHIDKRIAEGQKRRACVSAAADVTALKACMPERREGGKGGKFRNRDKGGDDSAQ